MFRYFKLYDALDKKCLDPLRVLIKKIGVKYEYFSVENGDYNDEGGFTLLSELLVFRSTLAKSKILKPELWCQNLKYCCM